MWSHSLSLHLIAGLLTITMYCSFSYSKQTTCCKQKSCADIDFEHCEKDCHTNKTDKIVVCYFTNWAWYRTGIGKFTPDDIDPSLCTHVNYAFAILNSDSHTIDYSDSWADVDNGFYAKFVKLKEKGLKMLLSIGGWNNSAKNIGWSTMFSNDTKRREFVSSVVEFMKKYNFSGLDVDYEYPSCPQGNRSAGNPSDAENFNKMICEIKEAFNGEYILTVTISGGEATLKECYNLVDLWPLVDFINIMTYDFYSYNDGIVGPNSPLCGSGGNWGSWESVVYLTEVVKIPAENLVLGVPFYGQSYTVTDSPEFGAEVSGPGEAGPYTGAAGVLAYYEICLNQNDGWETGLSKIDDSYAWSNKQFVSFDGLEDLKRKSCLIINLGLKGVMIWTLDYDDRTNACGHGAYPLLTYLNKQLRCNYVP